MLISHWSLKEEEIIVVNLVRLTERAIDERLLRYEDQKGVITWCFVVSLFPIKIAHSHLRANQRNKMHPILLAIKSLQTAAIVICPDRSSSARRIQFVS